MRTRIFIITKKNFSVLKIILRAYLKKKKYVLSATNHILLSVYLVF
jgi:hypothetical protein